VPGPDLLAFRLLRLGAHGWTEAHKVAVLATSRAAPEGVAEVVEAGVLRVGSAVRVFAVHDLRLVGVQLKPERPEPCGDGGPQQAGLFLGVAVGDHVVCVALKRTVVLVRRLAVYYPDDMIAGILNRQHRTTAPVAPPHYRIARHVSRL
jgi:hypothetical protein